MNKASICLWFDGQADEAANFCAATFPDTPVGAIHRARVIIPMARRAGC